MGRIKVYIFIFLFSFFLTSGAYSKNSYFDEGKTLFKQKKFSKSKFKFEKDIVFNPKNELSYLYLAKIFNEEKKYTLEKICKNLCEKEIELSKKLKNLQTK